MGNNQSKDYKPDQPPEQGMREYGLDFNKEYHIGGPFFIKGQEPELEHGIYGFKIYHRDKNGNFTLFFSFETAHPLRNEFKLDYDGSIVKFFFETDSFEKGLKHVIEYSFNFSKSFQSEKNFSGPLLSMPFLLPSDRKITYLNGKYGYYLIPIDATHYEFYIVESPDKTSCGFESVFKEGDVVIEKINVESSNFPYVMNDEKGNLVIVSADEGFDPIPIRLPSDDISFADLLSQESSQ